MGDAMTFKQDPTDPDYVLLDSNRFSLPLLEFNPESRPWVGLTDEEVKGLQEFAYDDDLQFVRHIEQLLKEKNNG